MLPFLFKVLGANSATPQPGRFSSAFILQHDQQRILLDCGEGCQIKMSQYKIKRSKLDHIFISHLHGDHIFGLPGLINSLSLNNRQHPLYIYGPIGIQSYIQFNLDISGARTSFEIIFIEIDAAHPRDLGSIGELNVTAFPLKHRIPTLGYFFLEADQPIRINPDAINSYQLAIEEIKNLKEGGSIKRHGKTIPQDLLTLPPHPSRSMAYCTDTLYDIGLAEHITGASLLYHEATYLHDLVDKAHERMHTTAYEAASIAKLSAVNKLVIGHYSGRYKDLGPLLNEACSIFPNSAIATEGDVYEINV